MKRGEYMSLQKKNIVVTIITGSFFLFFFLMSIQKKPDAFSYTERRKLSQRPTISVENVLSGKYAKDIETYATEQFPFREQFRKIHALSNRHMFQKKDNNGVYMEEDFLCDFNYPLNKESILYATDKFRFIYENYLKEKNSKLYISCIPDKNYFLGKKYGYPSLNYDQLFQMVKKETAYMEYIDIIDWLELSDYYKTDTHWKQECLIDVAQRIGLAMGNNTLHTEYKEALLEKPFYGVYYGQASLPLPADELKYLNTKLFSNCSVYDHENKKEIEIYDFEKANGLDPYEIFLSGPISLITIENKHATTDKELLLFRDSFGSSIAPLFVESYKKITLIDIRYIPSSYLDKFVTFQENQDVLFLYSTLVLNHSETLK